MVIVNLAYQLNRAVADKMSKLIHDGGPVYVGRSAGTMIVAKSMEMTAETKPGWLENFSDPSTYKHGSMFNANDLDGEGVELSVMGALRLFESPFAMRPHFDVEAHAHLVLEKNKAAEAECGNRVEIMSTPIRLARDSSAPAPIRLKIGRGALSRPPRRASRHVTPKRSPLRRLSQVRGRDGQGGGRRHRGGLARKRY